MSEVPVPAPTAPRKRHWYEKRRVLLPAVALIGFLFGLGAGSGETTTGSDTGRIADLKDDLAAAQEDVLAAEEQAASQRELAETLAAAGQGEEESAAAEEASEAPELEPQAEPNPDGEFGSSCDYLLGDFDDDDYRFVATAELENTGNIGIVVEVVASWKQIGADPIAETKTTRVKVGRSKAVNFDIQVGSDEIDRHQSVNSDETCVVDVALVDTFGEPRD